MTIHIFEPAQFLIQHSLTVPLGGNQFLISLSGVALLNLTGQQGSDWRREAVIMQVPLRDALKKTGRTPKPEHHLAFVLQQSTPLVTPNAFTDLKQAVDFGVAVDLFRIEGHGGQPGETIQVNIDVAARDIDLHLHRIGYALLVVGNVVEVPNPDPGT